MKKNWFFILILMLCILALLSACERVLSGSEKADVLAYSEPVVDNLFAGMTANDYTTFSRDFDADMLEEIPITLFSAWKEDMDGKFGNYQSRTVQQVYQSDEFRVVAYEAAFDKAGQVLVKVAFHARKPTTIAYMAFEAEHASWSTFQ